MIELLVDFLTIGGMMMIELVIILYALEKLGYLKKKDKKKNSLKERGIN